MFLISDAMAVAGHATKSSGGLGGSMGQLALPAILLIVFYFLLIRPNQKKAKAHKALLNAISRGDSIVTSSGICGVIAKPVNPEDTEVSVEIAPSVTIVLKRASISSVVEKAKEKLEKPDKKSKKNESKKNDDDAKQEKSDESEEDQ